MKKFVVKCMREFEVEIEADTLENAQLIARKFIAQMPGGKLLSILPEGYVEPVEPEKPTPPRGSPHPGGTPAGGTARVEVLVDQIAKAA